MHLPIFLTANVIQICSHLKKKTTKQTSKQKKTQKTHKMKKEKHSRVCISFVLLIGQKTID